MASQIEIDSDVRTVDAERHLDYIAGFPCTRFCCAGTLRRGTHRDRPAIRCSTCAHLYYVLESVRR